MREIVKETRHPGITYTHLTNDTPLSIHVVKMNPTLCRVLPARALNNGVGRECLFTMAQRSNAIAAINGGYFIVGGAFDGKSKGICKIENHWFASPKHEASSIAWNRATNEVMLDRGGIIWSLKIEGKPLPIDGVNIPLKPSNAMLYSWALHRSTLSPQGTIELELKDGKLVNIHRPGGDTEIPHGSWIYSIEADHAMDITFFKVGMEVELSHRFVFLNGEFKDEERPQSVHTFWENCDYILSGGPILIQNGVENTNYDHEFLKQFILYSPQPRSAVGVTEKGEWIFIVVEGRQANVSWGVSVQELASLMHTMGCIQALNLDGGASVLMVVEGNIVNTPMFNGIESDEEAGQRRISDAFLIVDR